MTRIASLFLLFALAGCGNKGRLVMPAPAPEGAGQPAPAQPASAPAPAEPDPVEPPATPEEPAASTSGTPAR